MSVAARRALLVGVERYDDSSFAPLPSCRADIWAMHQVLRHPAIGSFDTVSVLPDPTAAELRRGIGEFLDEAGPSDLALLYISGHGLRLRHSSGEFLFVARDTEAERPEETAVSAGFVNEQLEACRAPQKVTIIDACESGGFALGLRTRDTKGPAPGQREMAPLQSRGVYVLSSSGVGEASYSGPTTDAGPAPSVFTGEIVRALQDGTADHDGDGKVSVVDLFHHVSARVGSQERGIRQMPVYSAVGVNSKIIIANVIAGGSIRLEPLPADVAPGTNAAASGKIPGPTVPSGRAVGWERLLDYYRRCLQIEALETPLLRLGDKDDRFVYLAGRERILSGGTDDVDHVVLDDDSAKWARRVAESDDELWAGYPAVLLYGPSDRPWREPQFAPLVVRRVEVVDDGTGPRLAPVGPAQPHYELARRCLGEEEAQHLGATYYASWHAGGYAQMTKDLRELLRSEFELPMVEELRPEHLAATIDQRTPTAGARNVALLYRTSRREGAVAGLLEDLAYLRGHTAEIDRTALDALSTDGRGKRATTSPDVSPLLVTPLPCNESQEEVIASAMTTRLTVATGPPGSGKSQLVANAVATAVATGQTVLVASTNNAAVDEVWRRCRDLVPGLLVRTGSRSGQINYAENETTELTELTGPGSAERNVMTPRAKLVNKTQQAAQTRSRLAMVAELERELLKVAQRREHLAKVLDCPADDLADRLGDKQQLLRWQRRARRSAEARIFARWRRTRLLRALRHPGEPVAATCRTLADFTTVQLRWTELRDQADRLPDDGTLAAEADDVEAAVNAASLDLVDATVRTNAHRGRRRILDLLQAKQSPGSDWAAVKRVLPRTAGDRPAVGGWAVSSLSVRRFPTEAALFDLVVVDEASQCSIPQVLPLLFRARRALIIGDPMQLRHIATISPEREASARRGVGISADWLEERQLSYRRHSAFHALERAAGASRLLDEHYRCHPRIAGVVNRLFYGGQLTVLTDTRNRQRLDREPIVWAAVEGHPTRPAQGGSWVNAAEVQKVNDCVEYVVKELPEATVGVVTPYKAQADRIARYWDHEPRVRVGTVHTFQGGERDVVVFGLVAGASMPAGSIAWLEAERNLWNVAISRARVHLVLVGDRAFWSARRGVGAELATIEAATDESAKDDLLLQRLYDRLSRPAAAVELDVTKYGYKCDALVHLDDRSTAVLLDRTDLTMDAARHLRLQYRRVALLAAPDGSDNAIRLPAWKLYDRADPDMR
jgi:hypothetical protein